MTIRSISNTYGPQRVGTTPAPTAPAKPNGASAPAAPTAARQDSVSISDTGRALAGDAPATAAKGSLTPERIDALRKKVLEGAYNSTHVVDAVAKRLLSTGDV